MHSLTGFQVFGKWPGPIYNEKRKLYKVAPLKKIKMVELMKAWTECEGGHHIELQCMVDHVTILIIPIQAVI